MKREKTQTSEGSDKEIREKDSDVRRWQSQKGGLKEGGKYENMGKCLCPRSSQVKYNVIFSFVFHRFLFCLLLVLVARFIQLHAESCQKQKFHNQKKYCLKSHTRNVAMITTSSKKAARCAARGASTSKNFVLCVPSFFFWCKLETRTKASRGPCSLKTLEEQARGGAK